MQWPNSWGDMLHLAILLFFEETKLKSFDASNLELRSDDSIFLSVTDLRIDFYKRYQSNILLAGAHNNPSPLCLNRLFRILN